MRRRAGEGRLALPVGASLLLHVGMAAVLVFVRTPAQNFPPQTVSVRLVAARAGPVNIGVVSDAPVKETPKVAATPPAPTRESPRTTKVPVKKLAPTKIDPARTTARTDPTKEKKAADSKAETKAAKTATVEEKAGAGAKGSTGSDVVTATFVGLEFPDPSYLQSIMNKIMANFRKPDDIARVAEFEFEIKRDGCVQGLRVIRRSTSSVFDASAKDAIDKASKDCGFTALPASWPENVLRIHFKFDPKVMGK